MHILVTGAAGFIGYHVCSRLIDEGHLVVGYDGMTPYNDPSLKEARIARLLPSNSFRFYRGMLEDKRMLESAASDCEPEVIVHWLLSQVFAIVLTHLRAPFRQI